MTKFALFAAIAFGALGFAGLGCGGGGAERATTTSPAAAEQEIPPADADFSGTGSRILGPMTFTSGTDATWTSSGGFFQLIATSGPSSMANPQLISSQSTSGTGYVPAGHYVLKVSTWSDSDWTLTFNEQ